MYEWVQDMQGGGRGEMTCEHEYESYGSERIDRTWRVVFYECVLCGYEKGESVEDPVETEGTGA
jgi:hypothetical protein